MKSIVFCGFMGCGKSTIGKIIAEALGYPFCDIDKLIEERTGMNISEIFYLYGEAEFRKIEKFVVKEMAFEKNLVLSTGGGAIQEKSTAQFIKANCHVFFINVPFEILWSRIQDCKDRPLVKQGYVFVKSLFEKRLVEYQNASHFEITNLSLDAATKDILEIIHTFINEKE